MNAAQLERLQEQCARLRLVKSRERLEALPSCHASCRLDRTVTCGA
jgi:hypothetical protein